MFSLTIPAARRKKKMKEGERHLLSLFLDGREGEEEKKGNPEKKGEGAIPFNW